MEKLIFNGNIDTPNIILDKENGKFEISGKSFPEETKRFYESVIKWLIEYSKNPNQKTDFFFKMDYFNSSTSTIFLEILYLLDKCYKENNDIIIHWHFLEIDDDIREAGEEFEEMLSVPFEYKAIKGI